MKTGMRINPRTCCCNCRSATWTRWRTSSASERRARSLYRAQTRAAANARIAVRSRFSVVREETHREAGETYWRDPLCGVSEPG